MSYVIILGLFGEAYAISTAITDINIENAIILPIVTLVVGAIAVYFRNLIVLWIKKILQIEINKTISEILKSISISETVFGKEHIASNQIIHGKYEFPALGDVTFQPDLWNKIILHPLSGVKELIYTCEVIKGRLEITFKNFEPETDKGIFWLIVYYPDMVKYLDHKK